MTEKNLKRPLPITILSLLLFIFGVFAFVGSAFLWGEGFILTAPEGVDLAFPITDIVVNAPASILAALGLWKLRRYGYLASYFVAGFYIYASVYIFLEVAQDGPAYPVELMAPQVLAVLVAVGLLIFPERVRHLFR